VSGLSSRGFLSPRGRSARREMVPRSYRSLGNLAEDADDLAEDPGFGRPDRLHRLVLGLEPDVVGLAEIALDSRLFSDQGDDDLAVGSLLGRPHDDVVALEYAGVLHALPADAQDVI